MDGERDDLEGASEEAEATRIALRAAHRLNNIVTVILANTHVLLATYPHDDEITQCATEIRDAATRASQLSTDMFIALRRRP